MQFNIILNYIVMKFMLTSMDITEVVTQTFIIKKLTF